MRAAPVLSITSGEGGTVIGARGVFDRPAADRLLRIVHDVVQRGGAIEDLVLDLRATSQCTTAALECVAELVSAGMRLLEAPPPRAQLPRPRAREALGP